MSRTAFFADASASASIGDRSSSSFLRKVLDAAQFLLPGARGAEAQSAASQPYPWLPAHVRSNMGARAQRLIRADY